MQLKVKAEQVTAPTDLWEDRDVQIWHHNATPTTTSSSLKNWTHLPIPFRTFRTFWPTDSTTTTMPNPLPPVLHWRTGLFYLYHLELLGPLQWSPLIPPPKTFNLQCTSSRLQDGRQEEGSGHHDEGKHELKREHWYLYFVYDKFSLKAHREGVSWGVR